MQGVLAAGIQLWAGPSAELVVRFFQSLNRELLEKRFHPTQQACDSAAGGRERVEPEDQEPFAFAGD